MSSSWLFSKFTPRILKFLKVNVIVKDRNIYEPGKNYLFVNLNQESVLGSLGISTAFPNHVQDSLFYLVNARFAYLMPIWGWILAIKAVVVWKDIKSSRKSALGRCIERVSKGESLYMSIEGDRSRDGSLR